MACKELPPHRGNWKWTKWTCQPLPIQWVNHSVGFSMIFMVDFQPKTTAFFVSWDAPATWPTRVARFSACTAGKGNGWTSQEHVGHWLVESSGADKFISPIQDKLVMFISLPFFAIFGVGWPKAHGFTFWIPHLGNVGLYTLIGSSRDFFRKTIRALGMSSVTSGN